ncbi:glycosyltransferase family 4 protein [Actibacterium ureilyticum]|uniref:glycosyltransferase family 4 protein n=1 Tax=Actibacterium ureilyticum TaxID=1590614 RepID=UPI0015958028|nr:glycosyltransferase family 4 protein [Actibacterium ureilyticum]
MDGYESTRPGLILIGGDGGYSGVPTYIRHTVRALDDLARITVISDQNRGGYDFLTDTGADHITVPGLRSTLRPVSTGRTLRRLRAVLHDHPDSVVWAHSRMAVFLSRLIALRHPDILPRLAVTYHGLPFDPGHRTGQAAASRLVEAQLLRRGAPQDLVFLSEAACQRMRRALPRNLLARHRPHVLPNCSDLGPLPDPLPAPPGVGPRVIMTGRDSFQKNIAAAARLFNRLPATARLTLCGAGTDAAGFRARLAGRLSPDALNRIRFVGPVADVRPYLAQSDVFLLTSRYEGMPIAALEAFEAGLPVAMADIPGTAEILTLHPLAARLDMRDPQSAATAVEALARAYRADMAGHRARIHAVWASMFNPDLWTRRMQDLWRGMAPPTVQARATADISS